MDRDTLGTPGRASPSINSSPNTVAMDNYVQLPLSASALRKWARFSAKGGIGKAIGRFDKLAEPDTDQLMFMEGEQLVVLMQLGDGTYLGCCEGVVGVFHGSDVEFQGKLKRPVFTKSTSGATSSLQKRRSAGSLKSSTSTSPRLNSNPKRISPGYARSRPTSTASRASNATLKPNPILSQLSTPGLTSAGSNVHVPSSEQESSPLEYPITPIEQTTARFASIGIAHPTEMHVTPEFHTLQSVVADDSSPSFEQSGIYTSNDDSVFPSHENIVSYNRLFASPPPKHLGSTSETAGSETEDLIINSYGESRASRSVSPPQSASSEENASSSFLQDSSEQSFSESTTASTGALYLRRKPEHGLNGNNQLQLEAPLQICTKSPLSLLSDTVYAGGIAMSPSSSLGSVDSPVSSTRSPAQPLMPNLPKGVSLKQLRSSPGSSYSFPRRSPGLAPTQGSTYGRRNVSASTPSTPTEPLQLRTSRSFPAVNVTNESASRSSPSHRANSASPFSSANKNEQAGHNNLRTHLHVSHNHHQFLPDQNAVSSPTASSLYSNQDYWPPPPHLDSSEHGRKTETHEFSRGLRSPLSPASYHRSPSPLDSPASWAPKLQSPGPSQASDNQSLHSNGSGVSNNSRGLPGLGSLVRSASLRTKKRPSGSQPSDVRSEKSIDASRDAVVQLGQTEFEFVVPSVSRTPDVKEQVVPASMSHGLESRKSGESAYPTDYETDEERGGTLGGQTVVTRPSQTAKERVKSIYIDNQFAESSMEVDSHGFFRESSAVHTEEEARPQDPKALEAYRARELKWVSIMNSTSPTSAKKSKKVKKLVSYGIPNSVRGKAWAFLAEIELDKRHGLYHDLCAREDPACKAEIEKDLSRTFPGHSHFADENSLGRHDLASVLKAFAHYAPSIGYCQGLCFIVGLLLLHTEAESAFWLLVSITKNHMPEYFTRGMTGLKIDTIVLGRLVKGNEAKLYKRLQEAGITADMFATSWLLPLFAQTLPWSSLLRVIDLLLFSDPSSKFPIRVCLSILDLIRDPLLSTKEEMLPILLHPPMDLLTPASLIPTILTIKLPDRTLKKHAKQAEATLATLSRSNDRHTHKSGARR